MIIDNRIIIMADQLVLPVGHNLKKNNLASSLAHARPRGYQHLDTGILHIIRALDMESPIQMSRIPINVPRK